MVCGVGDEVRKEDPQVVDDRRGADVDQGLCWPEAIISDTGATRRGLELRICNIVWEGGGAAHMVWRGTETT